MKNLAIILGVVFSLQTFAGDTTLLCNDQNSHSVYQLFLSEDLSTAKLVTVLGDGSALAAGTRNLQMEEGESSAELSTFAGRSNRGLQVALLFNSTKAVSLKTYEVLEVTAYYQQQKGGILSGNTVLLCSKR